MQRINPARRLKKKLNENNGVRVNTVQAAKLVDIWQKSGALEKIAKEIEENETAG